ncbi:MAG: hypothetical protein HY907_03480 [Deltaproteobacteria bacterium]|nr:hypothetical protein [Deltaproteobacteria bacterium]
MAALSFYQWLVLDTIAVPVAVLAVGAFLTRLAPERFRAALAAGTLAAGSMAAHAGIVGWPRLPPTDTLGWLIVLVPAAAVLAAPFDLWPARLRGWGVPVLAAAVLAGGMWLLLRPLGATVGGGGLAWRIGAATLAGLLPLVGLQSLAARGGSAAVLAGLAVSSAGAALVLASDRSFLLGQLLGGHAAAFGAGAFAALLLPSFRVGRAAVVVGVVAYAGALAYGTFYAPLPGLAAALLALAPLAPLASWRVRRPWPAAALAALAALVPTAASWWVIREDQLRRAAAAGGLGE